MPLRHQNFSEILNIFVAGGDSDSHDAVFTEPIWAPELRESADNLIELAEMHLSAAASTVM